MNYHLLYAVEAVPEGISEEEAREQAEQEQAKKGKGACTAIILAPILYPEDGSYSVLFLSKDGRTDEELDDSELFKAWSMLAHRLAQSETLSHGKKDLCGQVFDIVCGALRTAAEHENKPESDTAPPDTTPDDTGPDTEWVDQDNERVTWLKRSSVNAPSRTPTSQARSVAASSSAATSSGRAGS